MKNQKHNQTKLVNFRLREHEREQLGRLAQLLGCTKTDAVRHAVQAELQRLEASHEPPHEQA